MEQIKEKRGRIGIDARFYGPLGKGLGRYVQEIVDNVIRIDTEAGKEFEYVIFLSPENFDEFKINSPLTVKKLVSLPWYSWREQIFFPWILKREKLDLVHFPHFNVPILTPIPFVVTIHDLILTRFPSRRASTLPAAFYWFKQAAYRFVIKTAIRRARRVIAVSEFTRRDIIGRFKAKSEKIVVTYEGVADLSKNEMPAVPVNPENILNNYHLHKPFLLYVGNAYPHKNLERLVSAFSVLRHHHPELSLVLVGKDDYFYQRVKNKAKMLGLWRKDGTESPVIFPGYVPDVDLKIFYQQARLYVFPSLYEGFGLPPLEAMAHGCPVASSNQASLPEIIGEAAMYFNPYDEKEIVSSLDNLLADETRRRNLVASGYKRIQLFSWQECARQTLAIYRQALKK